MFLHTRKSIKSPLVAIFSVRVIQNYIFIKKCHFSFRDDTQNIEPSRTLETDPGSLKKRKTANIEENPANYPHIFKMFDFQICDHGPRIFFIYTFKRHKWYSEKSIYQCQRSIIKSKTRDACKVIESIATE
ncbi:hypothetical protein RF11_01847 [Thelohanellus kitauei]|uniref:Uncharacterized protein n=1 Tax=Thelohanellus kitauei TaxID=669202 RepID=A0A0C2M7Z4_THEKT|nr:hypothetical protein RF11_01847 [Thelohanellus kitauei]